MKYFNFGENWQDYSQKYLTEKQLKEAEVSLTSLVGRDKIKNKSFLDIGSGSGIFSIAASRLGASSVVGIDISPESVEAAEKNAKKYAARAKFICGSILKAKKLKKLGKSEVVYSWGVLHHTGSMYKAIDNAIDLVKPGGILVIAIYNKHWSSPLWKLVKYIYNFMPKVGKTFMIYFFYVVIFVAKFLVTGKNPFKKDRGMSFYYDVVDWIGGYPYEYASKKEIVDFVKKRGLKLTKFVPAEVPTGCNEYVFICQE